MKPRIKEAIVVEGRYDKNTVSQAVDGLIVETGGFGIFSDGEKLELIRRLAERRGVVILTDPDGAGFLIRGYLRGAIQGDVKHAYIPEVKGRERRKKTASRQGLLGVEGVGPEVIVRALRRAGAVFEDGSGETTDAGLTKYDLYELGLSGGPGSGELRRRLCLELGLPTALSSNALLDVLNCVTDREELERLTAKIKADGEETADNDKTC